MKNVIKNDIGKNIRSTNGRLDIKSVYILATKSDIEILIVYNIAFVILQLKKIKKLQQNNQSYVPICITL